jgi:hypothetical protein
VSMPVTDGGGRDGGMTGRGEGERGESAAHHPGAVAFPYAVAGAAFTAWFNDRARRLDHPLVWVGLTLGRVIELHEDGSLEVEVETGAAEPERQFVPLQAAHLDRFLLTFAARGAGAGYTPGP